MERKIITELIQWKNKADRKPLILRGARQVGKTWIMKHFAKEYFDNYVYFNMDNDDILSQIFEKNYDTNRIIDELKIYSSKNIEKNKTLIIFDEIQEIPKALTALKYFCEENNEYYIICAGSLLGVALHKGTSFPVGKVDFADIYPLSFREYLIAKGLNDYEQILENNNYERMKTFKNIFIDNLKEYFYVGGMPEVVSSFINNKNYEEVRNLQRNIIDMYQNDFSKHAENSIVPRIREVYNSISKQLGNENKKFKYSNINKGARASSYEEAIMWLKDCGLIYKINKVTDVKLPSKSYENNDFFKLYLSDVGLLSCMNNLKLETIINGNEIFVEFKGALAENFVCNELIKNKSQNISYYANDRNTLEIDFLIDDGAEIIPVEVKSGINLRSKSLKAFIEKYNIKKALRYSLADYKLNDIIIDLPMYAV